MSCNGGQVRPDSGIYWARVLRGVGPMQMSMLCSGKVASRLSESKEPNWLCRALRFILASSLHHAGEEFYPAALEFIISNGAPDCLHPGMNPDRLLPCRSIHP